MQVKLLRVFGCHEVESKDSTRCYLRADYSMYCYDSKWDGMVAYAVLWIIVFVVGLLAVVIRQLHKFNGRQRLQTATEGRAAVAAAGTNAALVLRFASARPSAGVSPAEVAKVERLLVRAREQS